jgi:hypothetical protein
MVLCGVLRGVALTVLAEKRLESFPRRTLLATFVRDPYVANVAL